MHLQSEIRRNRTYDKLKVIRKMVDDGILSDEDAGYVAKELDMEGE